MPFKPGLGDRAIRLIRGAISAAFYFAWLSVAVSVAYITAKTCWRVVQYVDRVWLSQPF